MSIFLQNKDDETNLCIRKIGEEHYVVRCEDTSSKIGCELKEIIFDKGAKRVFGFVKTEVTQETQRKGYSTTHCGGKISQNFLHEFTDFTFSKHSEVVYPKELLEDKRISKTIPTLIGCIDNKMILYFQGCYPPAPPVVLDTNVNGTKYRFCDEFKSIMEENKSRKTLLIPIPGYENKYGLIWGKKIVIFDQKTGKFDTVNALSYETEYGRPLKFDESFGNKRSFFTKNKRVFEVYSSTLFEYVFEAKEPPKKRIKESTQSSIIGERKIIQIQHFKFLDNCITDVISLGDLGLLISKRSSNKDDSSKIIKHKLPDHFIYLSDDSSVIELSEFTRESNFLYCDAKLHIWKKGFNKEKADFIITKSDLLKRKKILIKDIYDEETLEKDFSVNSYTPEKHIGLEFIDPLTKRWTEIPSKKVYQVKTGEENKFKIKYGINCKKFEKLKGLLAADYKELEIGDFADFIGAPLLYQSEYSDEKSLDRGCVGNMYNNKRSSGCVRVYHWAKYSYGTSNIGSNCKWAGIPEYCNSIDPISTEEETKEVKEIDYDKIFSEFKYKGMNTTEGSFEIETGKMRITDPGYKRDGWGGSPNGIIVDNVKIGKWKYVTKDVQGRIGQITVFHDSISKNESIIKDFSVPKNAYDYKAEEETGEKPKKTGFGSVPQPKGYSKKPLSNGWFKIWQGIGVDTARVIFVDDKYFHNESICPNVLKLEKGWKKSFILEKKRSYASSMYELMLEKLGNFYRPYLIPYGVVSTSGWGDGCYLCLLKKDPKTEKIIAIRAIFIQ